MMRDNKSDGYYEDAIKNIFTRDGKAFARFRDSGIFDQIDEVRTERHMKIKNRNIYVRSFFPAEPTFTPTEKLLQLVKLSEK